MDYFRKKIMLIRKSFTVIHNRGYLQSKSFLSKLRLCLPTVRAVDSCKSRAFSVIPTTHNTLLYVVAKPSGRSQSRVQLCPSHAGTRTPVRLKSSLPEKFVSSCPLAWQPYLRLARLNKPVGESSLLISIRNNSNIYLTKV